MGYVKYKFIKHVNVYVIAGDVNIRR